MSKVVEKFFWPSCEYIFRISNQWEVFFSDNYKSRRAVTERTKQNMENRICRHLNMLRSLHEGGELRRSREGYTDALFLTLSAVTKLNDVNGKSYLLLLSFILSLSSLISFVKQLSPLFSLIHRFSRPISLEISITSTVHRHKILHQSQSETP